MRRWLTCGLIALAAGTSAAQEGPSIPDLGGLFGGLERGGPPDVTQLLPLLDFLGGAGGPVELPAQAPDLRGCRDGVLALPLPIEGLVGGAAATPDPRTFEAMEPLVDTLLQMSGIDSCQAQAPWLLKALLAYGRGRYNEADAIFRAVLPPLEADAGPLMILAHVARASIMVSQRNDAEAEALYTELLPQVEAAMGPQSPIAIGIRGALGDVMFARMKFDHADEAYADVQRRAVAALGADDPLVCITLQSRADALLRLGRLEESAALVEALLDPASAGCAAPWAEDLRARARQIRGTIAIARGDLDAAEADLLSARQTVLRIRGGAHPHTIAATLAVAELRVLQGRVDEAVSLIEQLDAALIGWLGREIQDSTKAGARRRLVGAQARFQDVAVLLALRYPEHPGAQRAAATAVLRHKGMQAEEEAALARLSRSPTIPAATRALAEDVARRRSELAALFNETAVSGGAAAYEDRLRALEDAEAALSRASGLFDRQIATRSMTVGALQAALAARALPGVLVEYRRVRDRPFGAPENGSERDLLAAVLIDEAGVRTVAIEALGEVDAILTAFADLFFLASGVDQAPLERRLFDLLVAPLGIEGYGDVFLAPDGALALVPFPALRDARGRHWVEHPDQTLNLVQSGRVLLDKRTPAGGYGMFAVGGVDFGIGGAALFLPLPASGEEAAAAAAAFAKATGEATTVVTGAEASEPRLRALEAPRVLHLATHGFYDALDPGAVSDPRSAATAERPLLLSGLALAGANAAAGAGEGILHAIEAQELALEGTELVVLSACLAGQGLVERGEGLHGLVRAFRIAGARHSLVALYPVVDADARDFATAFYRHWFGGEVQSLQEAYRATARELLQSGSSVDWSAFALFHN